MNQWQGKWGKHWCMLLKVWMGYAASRSERSPTYAMAAHTTYRDSAWVCHGLQLNPRQYVAGRPDGFTSDHQRSLSRVTKPGAKLQKEFCRRLFGDAGFIVMDVTPYPTRL